MDIQSVKQKFNIIGNSENYLRALEVAIRVAPTDLSVLITGESGVGKEVFSKIIHELSNRKHHAFIAVNCGAIPEGTIDSELFGHEKGAFTGAVDSRKGYFEVVNGGTIFLDEIGEMPQSTQSRLLRVLESGEYIRVGSSKVHKTDVRVIAATNVNLQEAIATGKFREDLYYRLNTVPINVPPLRERQGDIPLLFRRFTTAFSDQNKMEPIRLTDDAKILLKQYRWPGNIRELKNVAEQMTVLLPTREANADDLRRFLNPQPQYSQSHLPILSDFSSSNDAQYSEREIMYKLLFDMRKDINDLKGFLLNLAERGAIPNEMLHNDILQVNDKNDAIATPTPNEFNPYVISPLSFNTNSAYNTDENETFNPNNAQAEVIEESYSLADKEKEMIVKALRKYKGRRKLAAKDLGISERTLYRKIKEYDIQE
ncbi:MAG: sigma-54 dependent transcriptional regulator [Chitinophagales bacterium]|nr:sigma-54-dependent Fis family transcriptional regulator [Bacteroidota bacterium]